MSIKIKVLVVLGTRPEAIKMAPLINRMKQNEQIDARLCVTGQHREMLVNVLELFNIVPDFDLDIFKPGQDLTDITCSVLQGLKSLFVDYRPDMLLVHGDTTTTASASLAAFYAHIPVRHVEAGLRTGDLQSPWPEELNRRVAGLVTDKHYPPTNRALENLLAEGVQPENTLVTGNTVIDALLYVVDRLDTDQQIRSSLDKRFSYLDPQKRLLLVTCHRRESFGDDLEQICEAISTLAKRSDVQLVYPVHMNPNVKGTVHSLLENTGNVHLIAPLDYLDFVYLLSRAYMVLTDSGGIQEEAPSLGKPVLVLRNKTERQEAVDAGTVSLVGTDSAKVVTEASLLLDNGDVYKKMSQAMNPYGSGDASRLIVDDLLLC